MRTIRRSEYEALTAQLPDNKSAAEWEFAAVVKFGAYWKDVAGHIGHSGTKNHVLQCFIVPLEGEEVVVKATSYCGSQKWGSGLSVFTSSPDALITCQKCQKQANYTTQPAQVLVVEHKAGNFSVLWARYDLECLMRFNKEPTDKAGLDNIIRAMTLRFGISKTWTIAEAKLATPEDWLMLTDTIY